MHPAVVMEADLSFVFSSAEAIEAFLAPAGQMPNGSTSDTDAEQDSKPGTAGDIHLRQHASTGGMQCLIGGPDKILEQR